MQLLTSFPGRTVYLIGSLHSSSDCLEAIRKVAPEQIFLETTQEVLGLLRRNERHSPRLVDLPSMLHYADASGVDLRPVDIGIRDLCSGVFDGITPEQKIALWRFVTTRVVHTPLARLSFLQVLRSGSPGILDSYVTRWLLSEKQLNLCREHLANGGTEDDLAKVIEATQSSSSFLVCRDSDPKAFVELCNHTDIDKRLQKFIIDYRNDYMCDRIRRTLNTLPDGTVSAVVVGKNHIDGMYTNLSKGPGFVPSTLQYLPTKRSSFLDQILLASLLR